MRGRIACTVGAAAALVALSSCSSGGPKQGSSQGPKTVYVTATPTPSTTSASPSPSSTAPTLAKKLRGTCESLLPVFDVQDALGVDLAGRTSFVVGVAERDIGRLAYLNCRYGLGRASTAVPKVEIGVSLYNTPAQATKRANGTVADYVDHGAAQTSVTVSGHEGSILVGSGKGYDVPLLVVASGQRTIAISVPSQVVPTARRTASLSKLAQLALDRTGG
jgi:hypothetical protein